MLFNSYEFLLVFLPVTMIGFYVLGIFKRQELMLLWLIVMSLVFHAYWKASYTWLFVCSMGANFLFGRLMIDGGLNGRSRKVALIVGVGFNLTLLAYFKYANFISDIVNSATGAALNPGDIVLPLAISFYTFQQIAYLVDVHAFKAPRYSLLQYMSYLAFFPHLIAGPIVRHSQLVSQFSRRAFMVVRPENLLSGVVIIFIGLFKKVVLADGAAAYANPLFASVNGGNVLTSAEAWAAALLFGFVIYFDFSGYSDVAIGLARSFNTKFPENFASPYKSQDIVEFWRRWHITLSRFLRDYVYIPMGGNRRGRLRQHVNVMATMLLGGLWHGAGYNFIIWGGLHGGYIVVVHAWRHLTGRTGRASSMLGALASRVATFTAVLVAWVFFRTSSLGEAVSVLRSMAGLNGLSRPAPSSGSIAQLFPTSTLPSGLFGQSGLSLMALALFLLLIVHWAPNTQQIMRLWRPVLVASSDRLTPTMRYLLWRPTLVPAAIVVGMGLYVMAQLNSVQSFIYFRF